MLEAAEAHDYRLHLAGEPVRRNRRRTLYHNRDVAIADNIHLLDESRISLKEFLILSTAYFLPAGPQVSFIPKISRII